MKIEIKNILRAAGLLAGTVLFVSACSKSTKAIDLAGGNNGGQNHGPIGGPSRTVGTMYGRQLLASYVNVTGIAVSNALATAFDQAKDQLPQAGVSAEVSTTVVFATDALAAQVCSDFVVKEKGTSAASRRAFGSIDFTKTQTALTDAIVKTTADNLAKLFMSRPLTDAEQEEVLKAKTTALAGAPVSTATVQNLSLMLCSAIAASVEATQL